jgi:hypothetical protein
MNQKPATVGLWLVLLRFGTRRNPGHAATTAPSMHQLQHKAISHSIKPTNYTSIHIFVIDFGIKVKEKHDNISTT